MSLGEKHYLPIHAERVSGREAVASQRLADVESDSPSHARLPVTGTQPGRERTKHGHRTPPRGGYGTISCIVLRHSSNTAGSSRDYPRRSWRSAASRSPEERIRNRRSAPARAPNPPRERATIPGKPRSVATDPRRFAHAR